MKLMIRNVPMNNRLTNSYLKAKIKRIKNKPLQKMALNRSQNSLNSDKVR